MRETSALWGCLVLANVAVLSVALSSAGIERRVTALESRVTPIPPPPSPVWTTCDFREERGVPCLTEPGEADVVLVATSAGSYEAVRR